VLEDVLEKETAKWRKVCQEKDPALSKAVSKVVAERDGLKAKPNKEKQKIFRNNRIRHDTLKAEKDAVEAKLNRVVADLADATAANEHKIVNLKGRNL
jgi:hypothetical protein